MSANVQTMASVKEKPWHGIGKVLKESATSKEMIREAGLDWQVSKRPVLYGVTKGKVLTYQEADGNFVVVREDNNEALGVVGKVWTPHQNREAFRFIDAVIGRKEAVFETAGALGRGEKIWVMAKVNGVLKVKGNDTVEKYLLLCNAHDGTKAIKIAVTSVRVVCQNTLNLALKEADNADQIFSIRHSKSANDKVEDVINYLGLVRKQFEDFGQLAERLTNIKINTAKLDAFLDDMGFDTSKEASTKSKNIVEEVKSAFVSSPGSQLASAKGTAWGLLNAVTYYADHERSTRTTDAFKSEEEARFAASMWGSGNALKSKALQVVTQMAA